MSDILERLQGIFQDVFDNRSLNVTRDSNASNVRGWDSLAHIQLVMAIEQEFDIHFSLEDLEPLSDVGGIVDLIAVKTRAT
jgi:acyl carrier protein